MLLRLILCGVILFNQYSWAAQPIPGQKLQYLVSGFHNVGDVLNFMKLSRSVLEINELKDYLVTRGVSLTSLMPKAFANGEEVTVEKFNIKISNDGDAVINNVNFKYDPKSSLKQNFIRLQKLVNSVSIFYFFIPKAQAIAPEIPLVALLLFCLMGYLGAFDGITDSMAKSLNQAEISCNGNEFLLKLGISREPSNILTQEGIKNFLKSKGVPVCTPKFAEKLQQEIRNLKSNEVEKGFKKVQSSTKN